MRFLPPPQRRRVHPEQAGHLLLAEAPGPPVGPEAFARCSRLAIPRGVAKEGDDSRNELNGGGGSAFFPVRDRVGVHAQLPGYVLLAEFSPQTRM